MSDHGSQAHQQGQGRRPRILFLNRVYPPERGATGRLLRELAQGFAAAGWSVDIVTGAHGKPGKGDNAPAAEDGPLRLHRFRAARRRTWIGTLFDGIRMTLVALRQPRPDVVVSMSDPPMAAAAGDFVARWKHCGHIHWCQDLYPDLLPHLGVQVPGAVFRSLQKRHGRVLRRADKVVAIGRCMARYLINNGLPAGKISVIPNWPEHDLMTAGSAGRKAASKRKTAGTSVRPYEELLQDRVGEEKFRILYAGSIGRAHPMDTILDAAEILAEENPEIEFVFVGDGPGHEALAQARARRGIETIRFLPWQPAARLRDLMERGDLHLVSMKSEVAGMLVPCKIYSALAVARPVLFVGPIHCEAAKILTDFRAGAVVPQGQTALLVQTIRHFRNNSREWFQARKGAEDAGAVFTAAESIPAWIKRAEHVADLASFR